MSFHALDVALEIVTEITPLIAPIARHDPDLARQIRRALPSAALNLAEGRRRVGRDRFHHFRIADGSNDEVRIALRIATASGSIPRAEAAFELLDREAAMLWRLTHPRP